MNGIEIVLVFAATCAVLVWLIVRPQFTVRKQLSEWAEAEGLVIARADRRWFAWGPFASERTGIVFRIETQASSGGAKQCGWIRFGYDVFRCDAWSRKVLWDASDENQQSST